MNNAIKRLSYCEVIYIADTQDKIRTCIVVKCFSYSSVTALLQLSDGDLTMIQLRLNLNKNNHLNVLVGSVYMQYDSQTALSQKKIEELVLYIKERRLELLLDCNVNSHHKWENSNINSRGESLYEFIIATGLIVLIRGSEPTFMDSKKQKVIDILYMQRESDWPSTRLESVRRAIRIESQVD